MNKLLKLSFVEAFPLFFEAFSFFFFLRRFCFLKKVFKLYFVEAFPFFFEAFLFFLRRFEKKFLNFILLRRFRKIFEAFPNVKKLNARTAGPKKYIRLEEHLQMFDS